MAKSWFSAKPRGNGSADIAIFSEIGGFGVSAQNFYDSLNGLGDLSELRISISSDGGDVFVGFAIYNMLRRHPANKVVTVEGLAASMASVIAMAGDEVVMPANAMLMIHNPWGGVVGESEQIVSFGEALDKMRDGILLAYMERTGLTRGELKKMMDRETWLDAKEAKKLGFADTIEQPMAMAASASFNFDRFTKVPKSFMKESTMAKKPKSAEDESEDSEEKSPADVRTELLASQKEIRSLCAIAGKPELADSYIEADKTVAEVIADLDTKRKDAAEKAKKAKKGADEVSARHNPNAGENQPEIDPTTIYARWNKKRAA